MVLHLTFLDTAVARGPPWEGVRCLPRSVCPSGGNGAKVSDGGEGANNGVDHEQAALPIMVTFFSLSQLVKQCQLGGFALQGKAWTQTYIPYGISLEDFRLHQLNNETYD